MIKYQANRYTVLNEKLYRWGYIMPYLRCLRPDEANYVMREIYEGVCGNHSGKRSLAQKALRQGYYWSTMQKNSTELVQNCDKCQRFTHIPRQPPELLTQIVSPWSLAKWGIDLIGLLPTARAQAKFTIVAVHYFTKWVEAEPLSTITEAKCTSCIWKNIICRFSVPHSIIIDNGKQFDNPALKEIRQELGIHKLFSTPSHPQVNGQVEAANKTIKDNLKKKLERLKGAWVTSYPWCFGHIA